jgi:putative addiction module component (TIGR02574 family)
VTDAAKKILEEFDALSDDDQRWLVDVLVERVRGADDDGELSDAWKQEIVRRIERVQSGESKPIQWEEAEARLRESLRKAREA